MSLATNPATTVLPVSDRERARTFYEGALGLPLRGTDAQGMYLFGLDGSATLGLLVDPAAHHSEHTALTFEVSDIDAAMDELNGKGIKFEDYDLPDLKTVNHVFTVGDEKAAWFLDPDGNIFCIHQGGVTRAEYNV